MNNGVPPTLAEHKTPKTETSFKQRKSIMRKDDVCEYSYIMKIAFLDGRITNEFSSMSSVFMRTHLIFFYAGVA